MKITDTKVSVMKKHVSLLQIQKKSAEKTDHDAY